MSNYAKIKNFDIANGDGIGVSIFLSGCNIRCKGCFNKEIWDVNAGQPFTSETLDCLMELCGNEHINHLSILGGDGLMPHNQETTLLICKTFKKLYPEKKLYLWTGYDIKFNTLFDCLKNNEKLGFVGQIILLCDIVVDQPFIEKEKDLTLKWRGSKNQRVISVQQSLAQKKVILYDE